MNAQTQLVPAAHYRVQIAGQRRVTRRIFKWAEQRFGEIPCFVFTAPVSAAVQAQWNPDTQELRLHGPRLPQSEVSVPHYDLLTATPV